MILLHAPDHTNHLNHPHSTIPTHSHTSTTLSTHPTIPQLQFKVLRDSTLAYAFAYPSTSQSGRSLPIVVSRAPERYSSAAPLSADARQRIVCQLADLKDSITISVAVRGVLLLYIILYCNYIGCFVYWVVCINTCVCIIKYKLSNTLTHHMHPHHTITHHNRSPQSFITITRLTLAPPHRWAPPRVSSRVCPLLIGNPRMWPTQCW